MGLWLCAFWVWSGCGENGSSGSRGRKTSEGAVRRAGGVDGGGGELLELAVGWDMLAMTAASNVLISSSSSSSLFRLLRHSTWRRPIHPRPGIAGSVFPF
ncbi:hypothetical protein B0H16DRAFT_1502475, partial [Mycena metata]